MASSPGSSSLPASVRTSSHGALTRLNVQTPSAAAEVFTHGAHVARWQPAHADAPVLWMSGHSFYDAAKPIRGGVPICFPWFGPLRGDAHAPAHGFARISEWTLDQATEESSGVVTLQFALEGEQLSTLWPHRFGALFRISIGAQLTMALEVENRDAAEFTFEEALHTYLTVSDITRVAIAGLENAEYIDKVSGGARRRQDDGPIRFSGETDRVYVDTTSSCAIDDTGMRRRIVVAKEGSRSTVVWNPWVAKARAMQDFGDEEWRGMLCVETANVGSSAVTLRPGERHTMRVALSVEAIG